MAKVEVVKNAGKFRVQVTFREPFEDLFEICIHDARFENEICARHLADRVRNAIGQNGYRSVSFVCGLDHWYYTSSAYDGRYRNTINEYDVPVTDRTKKMLARFDMMN